LSQKLLQVEPVTGKCFVIAFSPSHNLTLADMDATQIETVVQTWTKLYGAHLSPTSPLQQVWQDNPLSKTEAIVSVPKAQYKYMQIFENKGAAMGCSNPHPHGQAWVISELPEEPGHELLQLVKYEKDNKSSLLEDYAALESQKKERVVFENAAFLVVCPWWATWPFEVMILSKKQKHSLVDFNEQERQLLAEAIADITRRYDNLFETHFPYSKMPVNLNSR
jgi:UDPglucose--hexose-1-phosphate uridylyltransferase